MASPSIHCDPVPETIETIPAPAPSEAVTEDMTSTLDVLDEVDDSRGSFPPFAPEHE